MNRPPKPAEAFRPTREGSKRHLLATAVLRPEGATAEDLMALTGWNRSTATSAVVEDLNRGMGMGVRREGDRYFGTLPEGVVSIVREPTETRMAANTSPDPKPVTYPYDTDERGEDGLLTRNACMARAEVWTLKQPKHGSPETGDISHDGQFVTSVLTDMHVLTINRSTGGIRKTKPITV
jgi:hypothetical protein